jgi:hypothetical protein
MDEASGANDRGKAPMSEASGLVPASRIPDRNSGSLMHFFDHVAIYLRQEQVENQVHIQVATS